LGRGGRHAGKQLLPLPAIAFVPLSPTLSPRSAGGEREKSPVAVSRSALDSPGTFSGQDCYSARLTTAPALRRVFKRWPAFTSLASRRTFPVAASVVIE